MSDLERRAEELIPGLHITDPQAERLGTIGLQRRCWDAAEVIEQLLSENRESRAETQRWKDAWSGIEQQLTTAKGETISARQDLERISAEREAYREFIEDVMNWDDSMDVLELKARRILAENEKEPNR